MQTLTTPPPTSDDISWLIGLFQQGPLEQFLEAAASFSERWPHDGAAQDVLGALYGAAGRFDLAVPALATVAMARPRDAQAHLVLGAALQQLDRHEEALVALANAGKAAGDDAATRHEAEALRGVSLHATGRFDEAVSALRAVVEADPGNVAARNNLAISLQALGRADESIEVLRAALALEPDHVEALTNLATGHELRGDVEQALAALNQAITRAPSDADLYERLGGILLDNGDLERAEDALEQALALDSTRIEALNRLGMVQHHKGDVGRALACFELATVQAGAQSEHLGTLHANRGYALMDLGENEAAIAALEHAIALRDDPDFDRAQKIRTQMQIADWRALDDYAAHADTLGMGNAPVSPGSLLAIDDDPARQAARAALYARKWSVRVADPVNPPAAADGRIRIGYFSGDFHDHATMHLMAGTFRTHDRSRFEITAYSYGSNPGGAVRETLAGQVDRLVEVGGMGDAEVAALARAHGLDIAVDLKGYTYQGRTAIFAHRPAPVQLSWLGFPGTSGAPFLDYLVADATVVPKPERAHYSERLIVLPGSYQPNDDARAIAPHAPARAELGLPEQGFVFCCFNSLYKIGPREFDIWMRLLSAVEGSVLWLLRPEPAAEANLAREAERRGIDPARLVYADWAAPADNLARLARADLFLDTFAYNAHTTASDALWAGVPLVTRPGRAFAARVAASLLHAVGLPELIAPDDVAYEALALDLARDPARLAQARARLAANRTTTPLFDTAGHTAALERAYVAVHERRLAGLPPEDVSLA
ncbi:tetratricopeptide repeat protein [Novosphingobium huizhouense]|uniref:tetratricopeptide repeat protein n=1 Tax=Novosphingobium huizhouense TaxID=2866625 RepID=UPI001CD84A33|nr:tetratricopeptide repeat protein [Novosphingobium huizhouense]